MIHNRIEIDGEKVLGAVDGVELSIDELLIDIKVEGQDYPPRYVFDNLHERKVSVIYGDTMYSGGGHVYWANFHAGKGGEIRLRLVRPIKIEEITDEPSED